MHWFYFTIARPIILSICLVPGTCISRTSSQSLCEACFIIAFNFGEAIVLREALLEPIRKSVEFNPQQGGARPAISQPDTNQAPKEAVNSGAVNSLDDEDMW